MPMMDVELAVFDMAGATIRAAGQVAEAFRRTLRAQGIEMTDDDLRPWRGASKRRALGHFLERQSGAGGTARLDEVYVDFRDQLERLFAERGVRAVEGAEATFARL